MLVTFNLKDFPPDESVDPFDLEVVHPDDFLLDQLDLYEDATLGALTELVATYDSPAMDIHELLLGLTRAGVPGFAEAVSTRLDARAK